MLERAQQGLGHPASGQISELWERCHGLVHGLVMLPVDRSQHRFPHRVGESYRSIILRLFPRFTLLKEQTQPGMPPFRRNPEAVQPPVLQDGAFGQSRDGLSSQFPGQARGVVSGKSLVMWQLRKSSLEQGLRQVVLLEWVRVPGVPAVIDSLPVSSESLGLLLWRHNVSLFSAELGLPTDNLGCDFIDLEVNFSNVPTPGGPSGLIEAC